MTKGATGVIGGGRMGAAIAAIFAGEGHDVLLVEPSDKIREALPQKLRELQKVRGVDEASADRVQTFAQMPAILAGCARSE